MLSTIICTVCLVSTEVAQRVAVPNLSWWPSTLSISHCLGEGLSRTPAWIQHRHTDTHTHTYVKSCHHDSAKTEEEADGGRRAGH